MYHSVLQGTQRSHSLSRTVAVSDARDSSYLANSTRRRGCPSRSLESSWRPFSCEFRRSHDCVRFLARQVGRAHQQNVSASFQPRSNGGRRVRRGHSPSSYSMEQSLSLAHCHRRQLQVKRSNSHEGRSRRTHGSAALWVGADVTWVLQHLETWCNPSDEGSRRVPGSGRARFLRSSSTQPLAPQHVSGALGVCV